MEWFLTSLLHESMCVCMCVCVLRCDLWRAVLTHTTSEAGMNADGPISDAKNGPFCPTTVCRCWKFAFLPREQHRPSYSVILYSAFATTTTAGSVLFPAFQAINISLKYLSQIFQIYEISTTSLKKEHEHH